MRRIGSDDLGKPSQEESEGGGRSVYDMDFILRGGGGTNERDRGVYCFYFSSSNYVA